MHPQERLRHEAIVNNYYRNAAPRNTDDGWLLLPEVPDTQEMLRPLVSDDLRVPHNQIDGNWPSKYDHLTAQYEFLREESTFALRRAIGLMREHPHLSELDHRDISPGIGIYEKAFAVGIILCRRGLGVRMCFSTFRAGVKIDWITSKRLTTGSLVALSPASDKFQRKIIVAIVGARTQELLHQTPPKVELFFPRPEETIFDPGEEYVFLEETSSFFEAMRHNMLSLQRMTREESPLQEYIVSPVSEELNTPLDLIDLSNQVECMSFIDREAGVHTVRVPDYVVQDPHMNLSFATDEDVDHQYDVVNRPMPKDAALLDESQMDALRQILTKELALIQGPPGTGKTHVSVMALRVMLHKMEEQRQRAGPGVIIPPLIVACQTNHALDQLLRHVADFEPSFIRLGGRSADTGVVKKRTLFNVMEELKESSPGAVVDPPGLRFANASMARMEKEWKSALAPFDESRQDPGPMDEDVFTDHLSPQQIDSIKNSKFQSSDVTSEIPPIVRWLGQDVSLTASNHNWPAEQEFGFEEFDQEEEEVDEATAEKAREDDKIEMLRGTYIPLLDHSVLMASSIKTLSAKEVKKILTSSKFSDLNKLPPHFRLGLYQYLVNNVKQKVVQKARALACRWAKEVQDRDRGNF
ncbi:P-loop containing nucleoside triphosphate hydrolase protein, partial [Aureobasidium pullulans]